MSKNKKIKKVKGGSPAIKNIRRYNNLKHRDALVSTGFLDGEGYILDKIGDIRIKDPITNEEIKYEDAILINDILYNINSIYSNINIQSDTNKIDVNGNQINNIDVKKIYLKIMMNSNNPNNLKSFNELRILNRINHQSFIVDREGSFIKDPYSNNPIEYKDAFLLDGVIYDVISLYNEIIKTGKYPDEADMEKIKLMIPYAKRIEDLDDKNNNLKSLETLKKLGYIDDENYFINDLKKRVKDPLKNEEIKYENAILINGKLYDVRGLLKQSKTIRGISLKDNKKIRLTYNNKFKIFNPLSPNNLKSLLDLKEMGLIDDDNYFINTTDPITRNRIKYEDAIFVNGNVYDITTVALGIQTSKEDIDKINLKKRMTLIKDTSNFNNLKGFDELSSMENVLGSNKEFENIRDLFTTKEIYYDMAILINEYIYDINSIYKHVVIDKNDTDWFGIKIPDEDIEKIKKMYYIRRIRDINNPTELISLENLKRLRLVDEDKFILKNNGKPFIDPYTDLKIKYENAIIINNNLYDVISFFVANEKVDYDNKEISEKDFLLIKRKYNELNNDNELSIKQTLHNFNKQIEKKSKNINIYNINSIDDFIQKLYIYLLKIDNLFDYDLNDIIESLAKYLNIVSIFENRIRLMDYPLEIIKLIFNTYFEKLTHIDKQDIKYYYDLYLYLSHFIKYLNKTDLNIFLNFCLLLSIYFENKNYNLFIQQQEALNLNLLKKRVANELAKEFIGICDSNDIDNLIRFLDEINKALSLLIISENEKILKILALHLIKKSLEIVKSNEPSVAIEFTKKSSEIAYKLSFKEDMKDIFEDTYVKYYYYLFEILKKIRKEYDEFVKILLKVYENILKIYMLSFMDDIPRYKLEKIEKNIDKYYERANKNIKTILNIQPKKIKEIFAESFKKFKRRLSMTFMSNRIAPNSTSQIESITIPEPKIPSIKSRRLNSLKPLPRKTK